MRRLVALSSTTRTRRSCRSEGSGIATLVLTPNVATKRNRLPLPTSLSTPIAPVDIAVGETSWALFRGFLYAVAFMVVAGSLGLIDSPWGLLALPGAVLIAFAFAGLGVAAVTYLRTWHDFEFIALVQLPMFLFSATFFPISTYPDAVQWIVRCSPLYHAISLLRALNLGVIGWAQLLNVAYLLILGVAGLVIAQRRVGKLLLK